MRGSFFVSLGFVLFSLESILAVQDGPSEEDDDSGLTAKELLKTIAPTYHLAKVPPGFPPLDRMNTDNFNYGTRGRYIKVVAALNETVKMVKNYIEISKVQMNFTYDKQQPENGTWRFNGTGVLNIGKQRVHVSIAEDGVIEGDLDEISFEDILAEYNHRELTTSLQFDSKAIQIKKVKVRGRVFTKDGYFYLTFQGYADLEDVSPSYATITVSKAPDDQLNVYAILEFKNLKPSTVLDQIVDDETMDIQFFSKMLEESDLIASNKTHFGITVSLTDVYNITYDTTTGRIIRDVLQSHIPSGITLLCPIDSLGSKKVPPVKLAFVMKRPNFDFLVDKHDKISLKRILKALSSEFAPPSLPVFLRRTKKAFTSHISFNSETNLFAIFVRMKDEVGLAPGVINSKVRSIVLVRNVSGTSGDDDWRLSVRGSLLIGQTKMRMRYAQMGYKPEKVYGMTAVAKKLTIQDVIEEFKPKIFATKEIKAMIENTEISDIEMENVNLFSRITRTNTPHLLLTGRANLPEWEDNTRVSMLLLLDKKQWYMKIALTLVHSPLSNILQAFTGFELTRTSLLHNNNIITSIVSSPLPSYSLLPPKIITTPLLRVPVATGLTVLALFKFPDNCGDDQLCEAAKQVLDTKTAYTFRGVLSLEGFVLEAPVADVIEFGNGVAAVNSTLVFNVGKETTLDLRTSLKIRDTDYIFDGRLSFLKSGKIRLNMSCRKKTWAAPFGITIAQFKNLTMNMTMNPKDTLNYIKLKGIIRIGAIGNRGEMETDVNLNFNPSLPDAGQFYANFTNVTIADLMRSFTIDYELPYVLRAAKFPNGLMLSYSSLDETNGHLTLHGDIKILGRVLPCEVQIIQPGSIKIITSNSPAPVILGNGQIIIEEESGNELRGPSILASINHKEANVTMNGFAKVLGLESKLNVSVQEDGLSFKISGKLMNFKDTELKAESQGSLDDFKVSGCFNDIPEQVQLLLTEIISKAGNQSTLNIERAEKNLVLADQYYEAANQHELQAMQELEDLRKIYEMELMDYGRFEVRVNDTCKPIQCDVTCFGCPEWSSCCHRDVFGECIKCASWKKCCWKDVDPICIAEDDGCRVVRSIAESDLSQRQVQIEEEKMHLEKMGILAVEAEENKGKHKAVLEAATDAKRLVVEDSGPGLNAADAIRNLGPLEEWLSVDSVCYNTSLEEAATGCMYFHVKGSFYKGPKSIVSIGSCLKEELVNELAESLANYMFPGIVDTSSDDVTDVKPDAESPSESPTESPPVAEDYNGEQKSQQTSKGSRDKLEQDALYQRKRRDIMNIDTEIQPKPKRRLSKTHKNLLENPFWDFKIDNQDVKSRSRIPPHPVKKQIMSGMLHKRWRIPENAAGRCHIFHQLIDICKDMADTIVLMDKSLSSTVKKYKKEKAVVTDKAASSIDFLGEAAKLVDLNETSMSSVDQTLQVVNEGIDIWASKCEKELNWQNSVGVQNWLASMDLRIQELGGFGAFRFLENLFHAFEALFEATTYSDDNADLALMLLQRIRKISTDSNRILPEKLSNKNKPELCKRNNCTIYQN
eukprot:gene13039-3814_t